MVDGTYLYNPIIWYYINCFKYSCVQIINISINYFYFEGLKQINKTFL